MKMLSVLFLALTVLCISVPFSASAEEWQPFWLTAYNDFYSEGMGVIFTEEYQHGESWFHVQFTPVEGREGVYEITETLDGYADTSAHPLSIPEGGFVWAINSGNDYTAIYPDDSSAVNYTSESCNKMYTVASQWQVGEKFEFEGIDLENLTVPTTTPEKDWYDPEYKCTAKFRKAGEKPSEEPVEPSKEPSEEPSEQPSEGPSTPQTGDSGIGMILLAVTAMLSIVSTAFVIKSRR